MTDSGRLKETIGYMFNVIMTFAFLQSIVILLHEFTHSTVAWLLGDMTSPFDIIWGNFLMMTCWDEGVHYSRLFPSGGHVTEAIIGGSPLLVHTIIVVLGMFLLQKQWTKEKKWFFHVVYWFVIANFMELIAYITMRSFASEGDVWHLTRGLGLSPWIVFIVGGALIIFGVYFLFKKTLPRLCDIFAKGNYLLEWAILIITVFYLFLWGSGLRVIFYIYPDSQWMFGLLGVAAFCTVLYMFKPGLHAQNRF